MGVYDPAGANQFDILVPHTMMTAVAQYVPSLRPPPSNARAVRDSVFNPNK